MSTFDDRLDALAAQFAPLPGVLVAFSGGVDSGVVLAAAVRTLGADRVVTTSAMPSRAASGVRTSTSSDLQKAHRSPALAR